ncbi:MAG: type II toxin-antitoxin system RelE/ParE family toxin [Fibromonadaceae bacterium]|jgi:plasmid stabilization system protein ParE|nr:type II toxin-antitoxin system RelE/ParE family toxin [Fibromonadaceae bacterium]
MEDEELVKKTITILPECEDMVKEAFDYIAIDSPEQAEKLKSAFYKVVNIIEIMPGIGTNYKYGMRKIGLGKFRKYNVYYRELETKIEIVGIWHTSRGTEFSEE